MQDPGFLEEAQLIDVREPDEVYVSLSISLVSLLDLLLNNHSKLHSGITLKNYLYDRVCTLYVPLQRLFLLK